MQNYQIVKQEEIDTANVIYKPDGPLLRHLKKDIKKFICPHHQKRFIFKCNHQQCHEPLVCGAQECIKQHFHDQDKIIMSRFDGEKFNSALHTVISSKDKIQIYFAKTIQIKSQLDSFRSSLSGLFADLKTMDSLFQSIHSSLDHALNRAFLGTLNNTISLEQKISKAVQTLKMNIVLPENDIPQILAQKQLIATEPIDRSLQLFLEAHIPYYKPEKVLELFKDKLTSENVKDFHNILANKENLVFLIYGPDTLIGSYFNAPYPTISSPALRDTHSFIFISDPESYGGFIKFIANPQATQHLMISQVFGICQGNCNGDGLRLNVLASELEFYLPSQSFVSQRQNKIMEGSLKHSQVRVLQIQSGLD